MTEEKENRSVPPYVPYKTFINFVDTLKAVGIPSHIDKDAMRSLSGGTQSWLKAAMRYMKLIDADNVPQPALQALVEADTQARKALLRDLFKRTYADVTSRVELVNTTPTKLRAALVELGGQGETVEKNVAFLVAMAKDAGIHLSPYLTKRAAPVRRAKPNRAKPILADNGDAPDDEPDDSGETATLSPEQMLIDLLNPNAMDEDEKKAVWTLLLYLKKQRD